MIERDFEVADSRPFLRRLSVRDCSNMLRVLPVPLLCFYYSVVVMLPVSWLLLASIVSLRPTLSAIALLLKRPIKAAEPMLESLGLRFAVEWLHKFEPVLVFFYSTTEVVDDDGIIYYRCIPVDLISSEFICLNFDLYCK